MVVMTCVDNACQWKLNNVSEAVAHDCLKMHVATKHQSVKIKSEDGQKTRPERPKHPEIQGDINDEEWLYFTVRWQGYRDATGVEGTELIAQLKECMEEGVRRDHHRQYSGVTVTTEDELLKQIQEVVVWKRNRAITRKNLHSLKQQHGEPICKFTG